MRRIKHFLDYDGYTAREINKILRAALTLRKRGYPASKPLRSKVVALIFQKPSTRTRVSFQSAIARLGGDSMYLGWSELQLGRGEPVSDTSRVLARYVDAIVARVFQHSMVEELAANSTVPVINALSDKHHPCQALADIMTVMQYSKKPSRSKIAFVGDGNNVCNSLIQICGLLGLRLSVATPPSYKPDSETVSKALKWAEESGAEITLTEDPVEAVAEADFVYTDVFVSMGQEEEREKKLREFLPKYQVNAELMKHAKPDARFMHCMPMHVGEEVTADVAYGPRSIIYDQAENRMHTEAALLLFLLGRLR